MKLNDNKLTLILAIVGVVLTTLAQVVPSIAVYTTAVATALGSIIALVNKYQTAPGDVPGPEKAAKLAPKGEGEL